MGNHRQQPPAGAAHPPPPSPTAKATSKYTNKDGSKFITVPKASSSTTDSAQPSPSLDPPDSKTADQAGPGSPATAQPVNPKKQKRREKERAKALAKQALQKPEPPSPTASAAPSHDRRSLDVEHDFSDAEDEHDLRAAQENGTGESAKSKKAKKNKKKKAAGASVDDSHSHNDYHDPHDHALHHERSHHHAPQHPPAHRGSGISKEKIWNTSSQEERQRIKDFWLGLGEDERKSLVKVEKDTVLKKMKEQQKHTCSCTVCGRKRTAIEEELEGLYDAYYEELEQYAHHPNQNGEGPPMMGSPKRFGSRVGSSRGPPSNYPHQPSHGRIVEHVSDDEDDDGEEYESEEEPDDDDGYDEDEPPEVNTRNDYASDFFAFGNSLTVQGGILTVADDLLKNDGRKFIEMMEQLAERRMAREEDAKEAYTRNYGHANGGAYGHSHPPPEEEEYEDEEEEYEEDDEEEYDSQEEEQDAMTEEQRMEEGRRMFQIFAARMFEQRVLTAYREKVAKERQQKLIEELEVEERTKDQRKAKKAKEAQKRKDKAAKKKEALAEEKARKEAEKAAEEEARRAEEARKAEEQRQKAEEKRKKKEAQRKAEEEERLRKEAERQRQREKQAEQERKAREAKEKEKKAKEEAARQREKETRERKELEMRERKEQQEREKKQREAKVQADREAKEKLIQAQQKVLQNVSKQAEPVVQKPSAPPPTATPITLVKRPAQHAIPTAVPALPQQPSISAAAVASPQIAIATPAIPKAPVNMRNRQPSQQESTSGSSHSTAQSESNPSQAPSPHPLTPSHTSPGPLGPTAKMGAQQPQQGASPMNIPSKTTAGPQYGGFGSSPMMSYGQAPPGMHQGPPPGFGSPMLQNPGFAPSPFVPYGSPGMVGLPGGINRPPAGRPFQHPAPPPGFNSQPLDSQFPGMGQGYQPGPPRDNMPMHNRQGSLDHQSPSMSSAQPIGKPVPIGRPPSVAPGQRPAASLPNTGWGGNMAENQHLGSSVLLPDSEEVPEEMPPSARRNTSVQMPGMQFPTMFPMDNMYNNVWGPQPAGQQGFFGSPPGFAGQPQSAPWPGQMSSAFGPQNGLGRQSLPRSVIIRQLLCRACKELVEAANKAGLDQQDTGYVSLTALRSHVGQQEPTTDKELLDICDTLGNAGNGGGSFETRTVAGQTYVRWVPEPTGADGHPLQRAIGAPGEIRSPAVGSRALSSGAGLGGN